MAEHLLRVWGLPRVTAWYLDLHAATGAQNACESKVEFVCSADLPAETVELVCMPVLKAGEAELTRELMQQAHQRLADGGYLATAVNNPKDRWLHEQMQALFDKVSCVREGDGCIYWARKTGPLKRVRNFECCFSFKDGSRVIQAISRPGVFSHRKLDQGAKQLMLSAEIAATDRVLDMGCGAGSVALASAFKTSAEVLGVDSNARAVECTARGAERNALSHVRVLHNADGQLGLQTPVDLALANPPYFGNDQISAHFVDTCLHALRSGGALLVVTKQPKWYAAYFERILEDIVVFESSQYFVACGRKP